jgi:hypothetical protein
VDKCLAKAIANPYLYKQISSRLMTMEPSQQTDQTRTCQTEVKVAKGNPKAVLKIGLTE